MPLASNKITEFPGVSDVQEPIAALPAGFLNQDRDPTREIRNLIDELQDSVRGSRRRQQQAEMENEQLRAKVLDLQDKPGMPSPATAQLEALTRERDTLIELQAQFTPVISDLKQRLKLAETEGSEAEQKCADAVRQKESAVRQSDLARQDRDLAKKHLTEAQNAGAEAQRILAENKKALDEARKGLAENQKVLAAVRNNLADAQKAVAEAKRKPIDAQKAGAGEPSAQVEALRQARDGMAEQVTQMRQRISALEDELADAHYEREKLKAAPQTGTGSMELLMETRDALTAAQQQLDEIHLERDALQSELAANTAAFEERLNAQNAEIERLTQALSGNEGKYSERNDMEVHFEKRRLDMIELNTMLENAHREIRNLSASLAEARLHAKLAGKNGGSPAPAKDAIGAMRRSFQAFSRDIGQLGLIGELETHTLAIAERAAHDGRSILHRVSTAFASLLGDLQEVPDQIGQSTLRTMNQSIEFIALLLSDPEIEKSVRLDDARVFVVDDDANTGATILDALNLVGIRAEHTLSSSVAIAELPSKPCDLILLDVNMPDLDGFELAAQIRNMGPHAETTIFFITGDSSLENRAKSSLRGANEFIAKPFSVQELALKALKSVITAQLRDR